MMTERSPQFAKRAAKVAWTTGLVSLGLLITACGVTSDKGRPLTTLSPKGPQSQSIQNLASPVFIVAGIVFVLVEGGALLMVLKYRRRKNDEDGVDEPVQTHGIPALEWTWTIAPAVLLAILAVFNVKTIWQLEDRKPNAMTVEVYGQQWWWEYRYDVNNDGVADIITANQMVIPAGRQINLVIRSNDVIHSHWIPALNGKKDAVPGHTHSWSLEADKPGLFQGTCTEFCGLSHARMRMEVKAVTAADFKTWQDQQMQPAAVVPDPTPTDPADDSLALKGQTAFAGQCAQCHQVNGHSYKFAGTTDGRPDNDYGGAKMPLTSGNAPNLTHLFSRNKFAGNNFDLWTRDPKTGKRVPNDSTLGNWLRNPSAMISMAPDENRGMPNLNLSQDQIDALVAYLKTLK